MAHRAEVAETHESRTGPTRPGSISRGGKGVNRFMTVQLLKVSSNSLAALTFLSGYSYSDFNFMAKALLCKIERPKRYS